MVSDWSMAQNQREPDWIINIEQVADNFQQYLLPGIDTALTPPPFPFSTPLCLSLSLSLSVVAASIIKYILSLICTTASKHKQADGKHGQRTKWPNYELDRARGVEGMKGATLAEITLCYEPLESAFCRSAKAAWKLNETRVKIAAKVWKSIVFEMTQINKFKRRTAKGSKVSKAWIYEYKTWDTSAEAVV